MTLDGLRVLSIALAVALAACTQAPGREPGTLDPDPPSANGGVGEIRARDAVALGAASAATAELRSGARCEAATVLAAGRPLRADTRDGGEPTAPCSRSDAPQQFYSFVLPAFQRAIVTVTPRGRWRAAVRAFESCDGRRCLADAVSERPGAEVTLVIDSPGSDDIEKRLAVSGESRRDGGAYEITLRFERVGGGPVAIDLGSLGGPVTIAYGVNSMGQVVGTSRTRGGPFHAFLWQEGVMSDLGTLGGSTSTALDINVAGQVVGVSETASGEMHAFFWSCGTMTDLGTLGGRESTANGINDDGVVVGSVEFNSDASRAVVWEAGVIRLLEGVGDVPSGGTDINNAGQIAGWRAGTGGVRFEAFRWEGGALTIVADLGTGYMSAEAINSRGAITGFTITAAGMQHAFVWDGASSVDLGTLGENESFGRGINTAGRAVGSSYQGGFSRAFLWQDGVLSQVPTPAADRAVAHDINDAGQIVGFWSDAPDTAHAFLLNP